MTLPRLDAARGLAAAVVCVSHVVISENSPGPSPLVFHLGDEAVIAFFLLSGFVIHWSSHQQGHFEGPRTYFIKRAVRVYSVWVPAMIAIAAIAYCEKWWSPAETWPRALCNVLMLQDISRLKPAVICDPLFRNTPLWSMHYEWWFYVAYPVVLLVAAPTRRTHVVGALAILGGVTYVILPNPLSRLLMYFSIWWIGVEAAASMRRAGVVKARDLVVPVIYSSAAIVPIVLLCGQVWRSTGLIQAGVHPFLEARQFGDVILLLCGAFLWRRLRWAGFSWTVGWFAALAPISFSLYLVHLRSLATASYLRHVLQNRAIELAAYAAVTIGFCVLTELVVYPKLRRWFLAKAA